MGLFSLGQTETTKEAIRRILIVEDEPLVAFDNEHALHQADYRVVATVDRHALAVEVMAEEDVDLVIVDIKLHGTDDGLDVARHAGTRGIPVLFSTGECPAEAEELGLGWLEKPYASRDLVRATNVIQRLLTRRRPGALPPGLRIFRAKS